MILKIGKSFKDYIIKQKISSDDCVYREVYVGATPNDENYVFLTVYSVKEMPACMDSDNIQEFELCSKLHGNMFTKYIGQGREEYNDEIIAWMATEYVSYKTLRELVGMNVLSENNALDLFSDILLGIRAIASITNNGGHYNVNPDAIIVSDVAVSDNDLQAFIMEMDHATSSCSGSPNFDVKTIDDRYRAKETYLGRFTTVSDIYSLGMLLAHMLKGEYPFDVKDNLKGAELVKYIAKQDLNLDVPVKLKAIVQKAISINVGSRYQTIEEFWNAVMEYRGLDRSDRFDCLSDDTKSKVERGSKDISNKLSCEREDVIQGQPQQPHVTVPIEIRKGEGFSAVAGMDDLKRRLRRDFVDIVSNKELAKLFAIESGSILFFGPPGTGKTYIAMRLAEECGMECSVINPSDLGSIYVHGSQSMIRELFDKAKKQGERNDKGVLLILDEFDALCPQRTPEDNNNQSGEVAEFLVQLNNCSEKKVYVIGTTNCLDRIDKAVIRKGRIDEVIYVGMPDEQCREQLIKYELAKRPHDESIDVPALAKLSAGFTSSDIAYLVKESARNSFEASLNTDDKHVVKISQDMIETVIRKTRPSVSADEVRRYEKMRDEYVKGCRNERPHIGYHI